ncbi:hypothetical protein [Citreimonas salinaria]|uniref:Uncharacterized protein n=1 Tax=Citreimonas salinaria TaxID=321339 RepID=A0A1H3LZV0_9RHOB|nr:hypothetical protein [Citreimonas salinaria]SDY69538.1 hypothetical protein SAMN05444340_1154 [Citreimonas salinaria]
MKKLLIFLVPASVAISVVIALAGLSQGGSSKPAKTPAAAVVVAPEPEPAPTPSEGPAPDVEPVEPEPEPGRIGLKPNQLTHDRPIPGAAPGADVDVVIETRTELTRGVIETRISRLAGARLVVTEFGETVLEFADAETRDEIEQLERTQDVRVLLSLAAQARSGSLVCTPKACVGLEQIKQPTKDKAD